MFPIHLKLSFLNVHFYEGIYFFLSFLFALIYAKRRVKTLNFPAEHFDTIIIFAIFGAIIGGRLSHFIFWDTALFLQNPLSLFKLWMGGISVTGGVGGGICTAWLVTKKKNISFGHFMAVTTPTILLGQAVGRLGCFLNGDAFGTASNMPWAVSFPRYGYAIPGFEQFKDASGFAWKWAYNQGLVGPMSDKSVPLHPTQLYEGFYDILLMIVIIVLINYLYKNKKSMLSIVFIHTGGYAIIRFFIEFIRADRSGMLTNNISYLQLVLLAWFAISAIIVIMHFSNINLKKIFRS